MTLLDPEGIAREIVQNSKHEKDKYFEVTDRINTVISCDQDTEDAIKKNLDYKQKLYQTVYFLIKLIIKQMKYSLITK